MPANDVNVLQELMKLVQSQVDSYSSVNALTEHAINHSEQLEKIIDLLQGYLVSSSCTKIRALSCRNFLLSVDCYVWCGKYGLQICTVFSLHCCKNKCVLLLEL